MAGVSWLEALGLGAALLLIGSFFWSELREEKALQLRRQVRERQRREQWERHIRLTCYQLQSERQRRHTRWMS